MFDTIFQNGSCYIEGELKKVDIGMKDGLIRSIGNLKGESASEFIDCKGFTIIPGAIDTQVHFREPGNTHKEDLESGSRAAVLGGITTFFEMPNTSPPTTHKEALRENFLAKNKSYANYAFFIGATENNFSDIQTCVGMAGLCGVKIFLGSSTGSLLLEDEVVIENLFRNIPIPFSIHSENERIMSQNFSKLEENPHVSTHSKWRSVESALSSTQKIVGLAKKTGKKYTFCIFQQKMRLIFNKE